MYSALGRSGGQQQRLCIARALAVEPEGLLRVEPTSALDPISTANIEDLAAELKKQFSDFLTNEMPKNPLKAEYFLPSVVSSLLADYKATVQVLHSNDKWYGVTYKEDKATVVAAIAALKQRGIYQM